MANENQYKDINPELHALNIFTIKHAKRVFD